MGLLHREQMYVIGLVGGSLLLVCKVGVGAGCVLVGCFRWVVVCARVQFEMLRWF